jgi:PAS domain S-box-containing protein
MRAAQKDTPRIIRPLLDAVQTTVLALVVAVGGVGFLWYRAVDAQYAAVGHELLQLTRSAALLVDVDLHRSLRSPEQTGSDGHLRAIAPLVAFHKANEDLIYVYTAVLDRDRIYFVLGTDTVYMTPYDDYRDQGADPLMTPFTGEDPQFRKALVEHVAVVNERPLRFGQRSYLSAYAPFFGADGRFEGVLGVDMLSRRLDARLADIHASGIAATLGVVLLSLLGGAIVYRFRKRAAQHAEDAEIARQALESSEERLRLAQASAGLGVWEWNQGSGKLTWTAELERLYGLPQGSGPASQEQWLQRVHPDDAAGVAAAREAALLEGRPFRLRYRVVWPDGSTHWLQSMGAGIVGEDGSLARVLGVEQDVTDNEQLTRELQRHRSDLEGLVEERTREWRASEGRFRGLVEQSLVGVFIVDGDELRYANPGLAAMLGYASPAELLQSPWRQGFRVVETQAAGPGGATAEDVPDRGALIYQVEAAHRDGRTLRLEVHSQPTDPARPNEHLAVTIDVTAREQAAQAREAALVAAEHLSRLKSNFISNMSHELRTPLNGIIGLAHVGALARDLPKAQGLFARIAESGQGLLGLIEQVLDFSELSRGTLELRPQPVALAGLFDELGAPVRALADARGLAFLQSVDPALPSVLEFDRERVAQVLRILLSNALKFTAAGTIELRALRSGDELAIGVRDTGIGIDPAYIERLFEPFEQQDGGLDRRYGGVGLGLALARLLAERMGGALSVSSTPGAGSLFELRLALREPSPQ